MAFYISIKSAVALTSFLLGLVACFLLFMGNKFDLTKNLFLGSSCNDKHIFDYDVSLNFWIREFFVSVT